MFLLNKNWYIVGEGFTPPEENEAVTRRVILSLSNPKGAAGGISTRRMKRIWPQWTVVSGQ